MRETTTCIYCGYKECDPVQLPAGRYFQKRAGYMCPSCGGIAVWGCGESAIEPVEFLPVPRISPLWASMPDPLLIEGLKSSFLTHYLTELVHHTQQVRDRLVADLTPNVWSTLDEQSTEPDVTGEFLEE